MYSKIIILNFPPEVAQKALVYQLTKKYDLMFNILRADISAKREGFMVLEISSHLKADYRKGVEFLKAQGVRISHPEHQIFKDEEKCTHCGACTAVCPTEALYIRRPEMEVLFDKDKCTVCELCILTCPTRAMGLFSEDTEEVA